MPAVTRGCTATAPGFWASVPYDSIALPPPSPSGSTGGKGWALYGLYTDSVEVDPSAYTPAAPAPTTSINLELDQLYMRYRVLEALQTTGIDDPYPEGGIAIDDVRLVQGSASDANPHTLVLTITPWRRGAQGQRVSLQRSYRLTLGLTPFLLTPQTEPDASKRQNMLGKTRTGSRSTTASRFASTSSSFTVFRTTRKVDCTPDPVTGLASNSNFDEIDKKILAQLSNSLAAQHPFVVPTKAVTDAVASLAGTAATIDGVSLGTDLDFKLGLHVKDVDGNPFDSQTTLSRFASSDWAIHIDKALVASGIAAQVAKLARDARLTPNGSARVEFDPGGILRVYQNVGGCLSADIGNVYARVRMEIVRIGPSGPPPATRYVLVVVPSGDADARVKTCALVNGSQIDIPKAISNFPFGSAGATACEEARDIQFKVSPTEWFYAAALDTDGVFYIAGRSTSADTRRGSRPPVPACS